MKILIHQTTTKLLNMQTYRYLSRLITSMETKPCTALRRKSRFLVFCEIRESSEKFVDWRQCAAVMQRKAVIVMPTGGGRGDTVME
jgi:hypothetical protein